MCTCNSGFLLDLDQKTCQGKALPVRETCYITCHTSTVYCTKIGVEIRRTRVRSQHYLEFFPEIEVELSKVTLEHESHASFPSTSRQLFHNFEDFSFLNCVYVLLHPLHELFLLRQLISDYSFFI